MRGGVGLFWSFLVGFSEPLTVTSLPCQLQNGLSTSVLVKDADWVSSLRRGRGKWKEDRGGGCLLVITACSHSPPPPHPPLQVPPPPMPPEAQFQNLQRKRELDWHTYCTWVVLCCGLCRSQRTTTDQNTLTVLPFPRKDGERERERERLSVCMCVCETKWAVILYRWMDRLLTIPLGRV